MINYDENISLASGYWRVFSNIVRIHRTTYIEHDQMRLGFCEDAEDYTCLLATREVTHLHDR